MSVVLEFLEAFNRKERYHLIKAVLGGFGLSNEYREQLNKVLEVEVPADAFVAMDYHLTWLYASLFLAANGHAPKTAVKAVFPNEKDIVRGNQEDIDLLVAFDEGVTTHIVIIEAKGVTGWTNKQLESKAKRLEEIFGDTGAERANVIPHFVLTSPKRSAGLVYESWPRWMYESGEVAWIPLAIPEQLIRVSRSDTNARPLAQGTHWTVLREGRRTELSE